MKLGLVGHRRSIEHVRRVIDHSFSNIEIQAIEFVDVTEVPTLVVYLKAQEKYLDGLIFTGQIPYEYMNKAMISKKPWGYLARNHSQLTRALFKANYVFKYDILHVSIDSFNRNLVEEVYRDIGITAELENVHALASLEMTADLLNVLKAFHTDNYFNNKVSVCITTITSIFEYLSEKNIPCILAEPTDNLIKDTIQTLLYKYKTSISEDRHIVALAIEIDSSDEFSLIDENEYHVMLTQMKVTEEVYKFAQKIQAAVVELGFKGYLLFSTKNILDNETNILKTLEMHNYAEEVGTRMLHKAGRPSRIMRLKIS